MGSAIIVTAYNFLTKAESLNIYINLFFVGVVYLVAFYSLRQKEIFPQGMELSGIVSDSTLNEQEVGGSRVKVIEDADLDQLKERLLQLMENERPYLNSELNLVRLAEQMDLSSHQLSYLINTAFGENFFNFINRYRVCKAKELLKNPDYNRFNVLVIAYEAGFNSKTAFNTTFKKMTNYTPTEYRRNNIQS
ncbi:helix-turn-helix domain-containing protein [Sphingobacterium haloxyli]|nr:AraC family transcriptional regulator [Sphingobacterium haloxyli]